MSGLWQERWGALNKAMKRLKLLLETEYKGCPRQVTLATTVRDLQRTAEVIFQFFAETSGSTLQAKVGLPVNYLIDHLLEQVAFDLDVLSSAAAQRFFGDDALQKRFVMADQLACTALQPAIAAQLIHPDTTVLTYMAQSARARVIPYAPVALIAIPFTAAAVDRDLLATAHEVGHYVYWHGQFTDTTFWAKLQQETAGWCHQWREEIFADIYGAWVAGAVIALSGQDLLLDNNPNDYWNNDKEHPVIDLRPHVYNKILHERTDVQGDWAPFLKQHWLDRTQPRREQGDGRFFLQGWQADLRKLASAEALNLDTPGIVRDGQAKEVEKVVGKLFDLLQPIPSGAWLAPLPTRQDITPSLANISQLYAQFTAFINQWNYPVPELADDNVVSQQRYDSLLTRINQTEKPDEEWKPLVKLHGWVTRGPDEQPNPPKP